MKTTIALVALMAVTAGVFVYTRPHNPIPSDLRDAVSDNGKFDTSIPVFDKSSGNIPEPKVMAVEGLPVPAISKGVQTLSPKICVTQLTAEWTGVFLVKFTKGTNIKAVMDVLKQEGLATSQYIHSPITESGDGFSARITIKDEDSGTKIKRLAEYTDVASVQISKNVYALMTGLSAPVVTGAGNLQEKGKIRACTRVYTAGFADATVLQGYCVGNIMFLSVNSYTSPAIVNSLEAYKGQDAVLTYTPHANAVGCDLITAGLHPIFCSVKPSLTNIGLLVNGKDILPELR